MEAKGSVLGGCIWAHFYCQKFKHRGLLYTDVRGTSCNIECFLMVSIYEVPKAEGESFMEI